jgi:CHASE1-domain containing sensor protein
MPTASTLARVTRRWRVRWATPQAWRWPAAVLLVGAMLTAVATLVVSRSVEAEAGQEFVRLVDRIAAETQRRLQQPVYGLKGLRGLYAAARQR